MQRKVTIWVSFFGAAWLLALTLWLSVPAAEAQTQQMVLVNRHRDYVERHEDGGFYFRPIFNQAVYPDMDGISFIIRDSRGKPLHDVPFFVAADTENLFREHKAGFEHTVEYSPADKEGWPVLDPEKPYMLVFFVQELAGPVRNDWPVLIPVYQPTGLWEEVKRGIKPDTWARKVLGWTFRGVHNTLCTIVVKVAGGAADNCDPRDFGPSGDAPIPGGV